MKICVTGAQGVVGRELIKQGCISVVCDITYPNDLRGEINAIKPDVLIHCAAITDVAYCESHFKESFEVNVKGTSNVVEAMPENSLFIYLSTDHVFHGNSWFSQGYGEWQRPSPINNYGFAKWGGEIVAKTGKCGAIVVRGSKLYNYEWAKPTIEKLKNGETVVFTDLIRRSFYHVNFFVESLLYLANNYNKFPDLDLINISGGEVFSYYLFWKALCSHLGLGGEIKFRREKLENEAPRPFRAGLDITQSRRLGFPIHSMAEGFELLKQGI